LRRRLTSRSEVKARSAGRKHNAPMALMELVDRPEQPAAEAKGAERAG
jgi:hypothetical protein